METETQTLTPMGTEMATLMLVEGARSTATVGHVQDMKSVASMRQERPHFA
jgi:hypothetical protein